MPDQSITGIVFDLDEQADGAIVGVSMFGTQSGVFRVAGREVTTSATLNVLDNDVIFDATFDNPGGPISPRGRSIEIAILATDNGDPVSLIDLASLQLSVAGLPGVADLEMHRKKGVRFDVRDVNADGRDDVIVKFKLSDLDLSAGDRTLQLNGLFANGDVFASTQDVTIAGKGSRGRGPK